MDIDMKCARIRLLDQELELLPLRAVWWPALNALVIADVHLGKDDVFRRAGVAIPGTVLDAELAALDRLLEARPARQLIVLGDWVHAPPAPDAAWPRRVGEWRHRHRRIRIALVPGNHDRRLSPWLLKWGIEEQAEPFVINGLNLSHEVDHEHPEAGLSGHLHPVARLRAGPDRARLPVFARCGEHLILPAFGRFTGGYEGLDPREWAFHPIAGDRVFSRR